MKCFMNFGYHAGESIAKKFHNLLLEEKMIDTIFAHVFRNTHLVVDAPEVVDGGLTLNELLPLAIEGLDQSCAVICAEDVWNQ